MAASISCLLLCLLQHGKDKWWKSTLSSLTPLYPASPPSVLCEDTKSSGAFCGKEKIQQHLLIKSWVWYFNAYFTPTVSRLWLHFLGRDSALVMMNRRLAHPVMGNAVLVREGKQLRSSLFIKSALSSFEKSTCFPMSLWGRSLLLPFWRWVCDTWLTLPRSY